MSPNSRASLIALRDLAALDGREMLDLRLQLLEPLLGDQRFTSHVLSSSFVLYPPEERVPGIEMPETRSRIPARGPGSGADYSEAPRRPRCAAGSACRGPCGEQLADLDRGCSCAGSVGSRALVAEPLDVPGIELAQVARGALGAPVLGRAIEHPVQLGLDLRGARRRARAPPVSCSKIHGLPSEPRAIITASAPEPRRRRGRARRRAARRRRSPDHGAPRRAARRARRRARIGPAAVELASPGAGAGRSRRRRRRRPGARRGRPPSGPRLDPGAHLDRHRQARSPRSRRARPRPRACGSRISAAPAPVFSTFGTGQPMLRSIRSAPPRRRPRPPRASHRDRSRRAGSRPGPRRGAARSISSTVRRLRCAIAKLETISETASPAPWRCACRRTNQLPIPASGASRTRFGMLDGPPIVEAASVIERRGTGRRAH